SDHLAEALQRRLRRLDDELDVEIGEAGADPVDALALPLVHDDRERTNARGAKIADGRLDQRHAGDRHHRLGHREPALAQPAALTRSDDAAREHAHSRIVSSSRSERICRSSRQHGFAGGDSAPTSQMWRIPTPRAPAMSRGSESPTKVAVAAEAPRASSASWKIRGAGFVHPTSAELTSTTNSGRIPASSDTCARFP